MTAARETPPERFLSQLDRTTNRPVLVVWEITLACDLKCSHCGSRAGAARSDELTTAECLDIVDELAALGTRHVVLIGGEAYLRKDFAQIIAAITRAGMVCTMQTGGRNLSPERIRAAVDAGLSNCGVSIDGLRDLHDELRGVRGSFDAAVAALHRLREYGISTSVNTQIARAVLDQLDGILDVVVESGATNWQLQLTVPMGRASDRPERLLQPHDLLAVMPQLADLYRRAARRGVLLQTGNNVGYFGPFEGELRGNGLETIHYQGCGAGKDVIGIEADGKVKGCPSLPTDGYTGGNVHDIDLTSIYYDTPELSFAREKRTVPHSFCGSCYYASVCRGGCTWMSHSLFDRPGDNPYCHHRALELQRQGLRESVRQVQAAPGLSFDHGVFEIAVETVAGDDSGIRVAADLTPRADGVNATELVVCYSCFRHVFEGTVTCPFCAEDVASARASYAVVVREAREAAARLDALLTAR
ncbi:MAG TPA: radical SAM protein [Candidatus Elarobacter sp.]|nr:radical SAM protein [Candidatus Elarobacter sp.]